MSDSQKQGNSTQNPTGKLRAPVGTKGRYQGQPYPDANRIQQRPSSRPSLGHTTDALTIRIAMLMIGLGICIILLRGIAQTLQTPNPRKDRTPMKTQYTLPDIDTLIIVTTEYPPALTYNPKLTSSQNIELAANYIKQLPKPPEAVIMYGRPADESADADEQKPAKSETPTTKPLDLEGMPE